MFSYEEQRIPVTGLVMYIKQRARNPKKKPSNKFKAAFKNHKYYWQDFEVYRGKPGEFVHLPALEKLGYWKCYEDNRSEFGTACKYKFVWKKDKYTPENLQWLVNAHCDNYGGLLYSDSKGQIHRENYFSKLDQNWINRKTLISWLDMTDVKVILEPTIDIRKAQEKHGL